MRKSLYSTLLLIFFILIIPPYAKANDQATYIVLFQSEIDLQFIETSQVTVIETLKNSPVAIVEADEEAIENLKTNKQIRSIEKDKQIRISAQEMSWGMKPTQIPTAWNSGYTGKGVKIAVIDSGIGPHDDLKVAKSLSFLQNDSSTVDENGHGTHVAGIIGALDNDYGVKGVAPNAELYALKVFNKKGIGLTTDVIRAIDWSIENDMDIINLSLTSKVGLDAYREVVNKAYGKGIIIVAAAGNLIDTNHRIDNVEYPARYDSVIAVSSINMEEKKAYLSAIGPSIEIAAPGEEIYSSYIGNSYRTLSGTSLAAAFVTGQFALLKEAYPSLNNVQLRKKMMDDAKDLGAKGRDSIFGYGLIQSGAYELPLYEYPAKRNPAVALSFSEEVVVGAAGETIETKVFAELKNGQHVDVSEFARWGTKNKAIATARRGKIDLHQIGETSFHVTYGGLQAELLVKVNDEESEPSMRELPFKDIPADHHAREAIQFVYDKFIINGYEDGTFRPTETIQRMHVATMLGRTVEVEKKRAIDPFLDVKMDSPYFYDIMKMQQASVFTGDNKMFKPHSDLTRAQMAKILVQAFDLPEASNMHPFPDVPKGHWSNDYISALYESGITTGSEGLYLPERSVTRAEFSVFIKRALARENSH